MMRGKKGNLKFEGSNLKRSKKNWQKSEEKLKRNGWKVKHGKKINRGRFKKKS